MVTLGKLEWIVEVKKAENAKEKAQAAAEGVQQAKEEAAGASERFQQFAGSVKDAVYQSEILNNVFDRLSAQAGFLTTGISGALSAIKGFMLLISKALLPIAALVAAIVGLAFAYKKNFGQIRDNVKGAVAGIKKVLKGLGEFVKKVISAFVSGFKKAGGDLGDVETIFKGFVDGLSQGFNTLYQDIVLPLSKKLGPILVDAAKLIGKVVGKVTSVTAKMEKEGGLVTKITKIATVVGGLAVGAKGLAAAFTKVAGVVKTFGGYISTAVGYLRKAGPIFRTIGSLIMRLAPYLRTVGSLVLRFGSYFLRFGAIKSAVTTAVSAIVSVLGGPLTVAIAAVVAAVIGLYAAWKTNLFGIRDKVNAVINTVTGYFRDFQSFLASLPGKLSSIGSDIVSTISSGISSGISAVNTAISNVVSTIAAYLPIGGPATKGPLVGVRAAGARIISQIYAGIRSRVSNLVSGVRDIVNTVKDWVNSVWKNATAAGQRLIANLRRGIVNRVTNLYESVNQIVQNLFDALGNLYRDAVQWGRDIIQGVADGISEAAGEVTDAVSGVADSISSHFPSSPVEVGPLQGIMDSGNELVEGISSGIEESGAKVESSLKDTFKSVGKMFPKSGKPSVGPTKKAMEGARKTAENIVDNVAKGTAGAVNARNTNTSPRQRQPIGSDSGSGDTQVDVGGIEIGDQTLDLSKLSRSEMRELSRMVADQIGEDVLDRA